MTIPPNLTLVPCPPMHARITAAACVEIFTTGHASYCQDCPLARERGATGPWRYRAKGQPAGAAGRSPGQRAASGAGPGSNTGRHREAPSVSRAWNSAGLTNRNADPARTRDIAWLRMRIEESGLSQAAFARELDLHEAQLSAVLRGREGMSRRMRELVEAGRSVTPTATAEVRP